MGRRKPNYTLVTINHGAIDYETFADASDLQVAMKKLTPEVAATAVLFDSPPISFIVDREPRLIIGGATEPATHKKPRAKRRTKAEIEAAKAHKTIGRTRGSDDGEPAVVVKA